MKTNSIQMLRHSLPYALLSLTLAEGLLYIQHLHEQIDSLESSNRSLTVKTDKREKAFHKELSAAIKQIESLEDILKKRLKESITLRREPDTPLKSFRMQHQEREMITEKRNDNAKKAQMREEDLERELEKIFSEHRNAHNHPAHSNRIQQLVCNLAKEELDKKYVWGAAGPDTYDCSGFTHAVFQKLGIEIPRVSKAQAKKGLYVEKEALQMGDLLFFDTSKEQKGINHVGIYLGNDKFIHASSAGKAVVITSLDAPFYAKHYRWARRLINTP